MLYAVGGPSNIKHNDPNNPYPGLTNFSLLSHGFGNPAINTSLSVVQTYLQELLAFYTRAANPYNWRTDTLCLVASKCTACCLTGCPILHTQLQLVKFHDPNPTESVVYKTSHSHTGDGPRDIFFSDPPHLIKTTRNCWNTKCRSLWVSSNVLSK